MAKKSNAGRPTVMTPEVVCKLEEAFSLGCTDEEACFHAGISRSTLHKYCTETPKFSDRKELLKKAVVFKARKEVENAVIGGDMKTVMWLIEKNDGKAKQQVDNISSDGSMTPQPTTIKYVDPRDNDGNTTPE